MQRNVFSAEKIKRDESVKNEKMKIVYKEDNKTKVARGTTTDIGNFIKVEENGNYILLNKKYIVSMRAEQQR